MTSLPEFGLETSWKCVLKWLLNWFEIAACFWIFTGCIVDDCEQRDGHSDRQIEVDRGSSESGTGGAVGEYGGGKSWIGEFPIFIASSYDGGADGIGPGTNTIKLILL